MTTRRALMVTHQFTVAGAPPKHGVTVAYWPTPDDTWSRGLGSLLDRVSKSFDGEGVLLLDQEAATALKLPAGPEDATTVGLDDARAAGWLSGKVHAWTPFRQEGRPRVIVGITSWPSFSRCPLWDPTDEAATIERLAMWHDWTGRAWMGNPGVCGLTLLRALAPSFRGSDGKPFGPTYTYQARPPVDEEATELEIKPDDWSRPQTARYAHSYDARRMYQAAAGACERFAPWTLKRTGKIPFDSKLGGWWKVELGPWNVDTIPAPAGPCTTPDEHGNRVVKWVTTPTLELLTQLAEAGEEFQEFEIIDSFTGPAKRLMRRYAETLEHTYQEARSRVADEDDPQTADERDAAAVIKAVKAVYREANGMLNYVPEGGGKNVTYRPDWHYTVIAQARANLWRKLWQVGKTEDRWPIEIDTDEAWYESDDPDPEKSRPAGLPRVNKKGVEDALGTFRCKREPRVKEAEK